LIRVNTDAQQREAERVVERVVLGGGKPAAPRAGEAVAVNDLLVCAQVDAARRRLGIAGERRRGDDGQGARSSELRNFHFGCYN
jgi:hypothetical protein